MFLIITRNQFDPYIHCKLMFSVNVNKFLSEKKVILDHKIFLLSSEKLLQNRDTTRRRDYFEIFYPPINERKENARAVFPKKLMLKF